MTTTTFNTLHHYEKMIDAGFTEKQAKAQTDSIAQLVDEKLATKKDLKEIKKEMIIWLGGIVIIASGIIIAIVGHLISLIKL